VSKYIFVLILLSIHLRGNFLGQKRNQSAHEMYKTDSEEMTNITEITVKCVPFT